ncbi:MAG TPA: MFS transporter, partial [Candidatus Limosilactobacillus merdipullorum]|nr:MFS transporter [Candidatus Limosilactobacillus merdipullorum]
ANSRNNSIFMFSYFIGGYVGKFVGINVWNLWGWAGVTSAAAIFLLIALANYIWLGVPKKLG